MPPWPGSALFDTHIAVTVRGPFFLIQAVVADLRRRGAPGTIANIGSISELGGPGNGRPEELPMGRLSDPAEIAHMVVFLLSSRSGVVTGSVIEGDQTVPGAQD